MKDNLIEFKNGNTIETIRETKTLEESNEVLESIFDGIDMDALGEQLDVKPLIAALALPEKEFAFIQEVLLNQMEKQLNSVQDKLLLVQALNAGGMKAEDLVATFDNITEQIEAEFDGKLSQQKIDFLKRFMGLFTQSVSETEGIAKRTIPIPIEFVHKDAKRPEYAKAGDAGLDVYAVEDITIQPGETVIVPVGFKVAIPLGYELQVRPRSGLSAKSPLRIANTPGTIDSGFRGEVGIIVTNTDPKIRDVDIEYEGARPIIKSILHGQAYTITKGMRFAQLVLNEVPSAAFFEVDSVGEIGFDRASGFGRTGVF